MSYRHFTRDERNVIYTMQVQGYPPAEIARCLGRHRSTIGRECKRNAHGDGRYFAGEAQTWANSRRRAHLRRPKTEDRRLMSYVAERLADHWSPEQIAGKRSIEERPKEANARQRLGDWEGDTVVGKGRKGFVLTCVDRASRYLIARKVDACAAEPVAHKLQQSVRRLPADKRRTLTLDNGLLRQYLPKGTDLTRIAHEQLRSYVHQLNHRPRKCLDFQTPSKSFIPSEQRFVWGPLLRPTHDRGKLNAPLGRIGLCREATRAPQRSRGMGDVVSLRYDVA